MRRKLSICITNPEASANGGIKTCQVPVDDPAHVRLEVAEVSDQHLLHLDQIHQTLVQVDEAHASLENVKGLLASIMCNWTSCG